ncbi:YczE/YyaS/YitT family protein [Thalassobacillus hwangdonensis]|uniref:YitT family protein n=1 Tax=Thalassobacillus hwangdonensis TaxID=546108 RepID=A0ABW3L2Q7_9BACI
MSKQSMTIKQNILRWAFFFSGLLILGFGIAMTMQAKDLGIGPWDVFHYGLFLQLGLTVGTWSIITGLLIVLLSALFLKEWPQIGTILNMVLIGVFIDLFNWLLPEPETLLAELIVFVTGTVVMAYGIGIYVAANLGAGPRDSLMLVLTDLTGLKVSTIRNLIEITVFLLGWMLGGPLGAGTVFIAFFLGTLVGHTLPQSRKLLEYSMKKGEHNENIDKRPLWADNHD